MLEFEWHNKKNKANLQKHNLSFKMAKSVFEDKSFISLKIQKNIKNHS
jgi:uncharacterized DUF497 family protein